MEDHRKILATIDDMIQCPPDAGMKRARLFLMLKQKLAKHAMAEEEVVYPLLHQGDRSGQSKHLYDEHADMKILLFDLEQRLKNREGWPDVASSLRDLVQRHVNEEERQVFPHLRQSTNKKLSEVSVEIYREEALIL